MHHKPMSTAAAVYISADVDYDRVVDDEVQVFTVYVGDDDAEPVGTVYNCRTENAAWNLGERMARDRRLSLVGPND